MDILGQLGGLGPLTSGGVLLLVVILVIRGDLVPRKILQEMRQDRDEWKATCELERKRLEELSTQVRALADGQKTELRLIRSIQGVNLDE